MTNRGVNLSAFDPLAASASQQQQPNATSSTTRTSTNASTAHATPATTTGQHQQHHSLNANQVQYLQQQGFSSGLIAAFGKYAACTPLRVWILDNSQAMSIRDAHRISGDIQHIQNATNVTRWEELQDCVAYHAQAASLLPVPTRFALVNPPLDAHIGPAVFGVGEQGPAGIAREVQVLQNVMTRVQPAGPTLLSKHLKTLHKYISSIAPQLGQNRQTASIVLATQGLPTDEKGNTAPHITQEFVQCLQAFSNLPVMLIVRLCTDDESVFDFYNSLDAHLNLNYDVLDDFFGESLEVYLRNPWLTYGLPLHRFRETGFQVSVFDAIDERALTLPEVLNVMGLLFGNVNFPNPETDWNSFLNSVQHAMSREAQQWNPITKSVTPWINLQMLHTIYNPNTRPSAPHGQQAAAAPQQQPMPGQQYQQQQYPPQQQPPPRPAAPAGHQQEQQQRAPHPQSFASSPQPPPPQPQAQTSTATGQNSQDAISILKKGILTTWALQPPTYRKLRSIQVLLSSVHKTFPPAFGVERNAYFDKLKPFSTDALSSNNTAVLKRAVRKLKFFLHPDKLPRDFDEQQKFLCKTLWDVTADAWEEFEK